MPNRESQRQHDFALYVLFFLLLGILVSIGLLAWVLKWKTVPFGHQKEIRYNQYFSDRGDISILKPTETSTSSDATSPASSESKDANDTVEPERQEDEIAWVSYVSQDFGYSFEYPKEYVLQAHAFMEEEEEYGLETLLETVRMNMHGERPPGFEGEGPPIMYVWLWENPDQLSLKEWAAVHQAYSGYGYYDQMEVQPASIHGRDALMYTGSVLYESRTYLIAVGEHIIQIVNQDLDPGDVVIGHIARSFSW